MLGLDQDAAGFARLARRLGLARLVAGRPGLRLIRTPSVLDGLLWSIIGQQINLPFACVLKRRLIENTGTALPGGLFSLPTAAAIARLTPSDMRPWQYSRQKAEYLIGAAQLVAAGTLDLDALPAMSATRAERTLLSVRGLGPWSVNYLMMRSLGFADCVPIGDTGVTSGLQALFRLEERPDADATRRLMSVFSPHRSLATAHLWQINRPTTMNKSPIFHFSSFKTPEGRFSVAVDAAGSVVATAFGGEAALRGRLARAPWSRTPRGQPRRAGQIEAWFLGRRRDFSLGLSPAGTPFQRRVWAALGRIPYGQTRSYGDLARALRSSPRAVGRANATNPDLSHRPLPPRDRIRRIPHRLRVRRSQEAPAPRAREGLAYPPAALWTATMNAFSRAWSFTPGADSTPLFTSTNRAPVPARASPTFSGLSPPDRIHVFSGLRSLCRLNFGQSPVRPVPPKSVGSNVSMRMHCASPEP